VFIAGLEEGLFPHSRSLDEPAMLEEERRLCYVGMTRAQKRLFLTWAQRRRRFGGGPYELQEPSRFLREVPPQYLEISGAAPPAEFDESPAGVDLFVEQHEVRQAARKHAYTGKTYNSVENIAEFFRERGLPPPQAAPKPPAVPPKPAAKAPGGGFRAGATVEHPKYGKGLVLRREGQGDDTKLTVSFPGYGLKKLVAKYAGLKIDE
jgi:DNA helicase-2/ATP-dependent DNA helicase PcrA